MKNIGLTRCISATAENFTTDRGIQLRRRISPMLRICLRLAAKHRIVVEQYPVLAPGQPYIFASTHYFQEDIIANLAAIDRSTWVLVGRQISLSIIRKCTRHG